MILTLESRVQRLNEMVEEDRIARYNWFGIDEQGRDTACLLAALSPEVAEAETASACPVSLMPQWLAYLTPWMDDNCSEAEWSRMIRRYAACAARWSVLDDAAWRRVEIAARRAAVEEAMRHASDEQALDACRQVLAWLDADTPESSQVDVNAAEAARAAAWAATAQGAAAWAARQAAASAAWAEAWEAAAWARAAAWASCAGSAGAESATEAAMAAVKAAADTAWSVAKYEAADRIIDAVLSALEKECGVCE